MTRSSFLTAAVVAALTAGLAGQCPTPPSGFANNTSVHGVELNINTSSDSTNNSLLNTTQDNVATASVGEGISFTLSNNSGAAGQPLAILYNIGGPTGPVTLPSGGDVWLPLTLPFFAIADGLGIATIPPDPTAAHPGPGLLYSHFVSIPDTSVLGGVCITFQAVIQDPSVPSSVRLSNAVMLNIVPNVDSFVPNFGPEGSTVNVSTTGSGQGIAHFQIFNPVNNTLLGSTAPSPLTSPTTVIVAPGADSGVVQYEDQTLPGVISSNSPDQMASFFAVTDPNGVVSNATPGPLTLQPSPFSNNELWATATATLSGSNAVDTWTISGVAGDVVQVEVYSMDTGQTRVLNGFGSTFDPAATEGFDPLINIAHATNVMPLTFDATSMGPFPVQGDDDSGPGFNARARFQVRQSDTIQILVGTGFPGTFVTGDYLLNVRVLTGEASVSGFTIQGTTPANVAAPGTQVTVNGAGIQSGLQYNVLLTPVHGLYAPVSVGPVTANPSALTFTMPSFAAGTFGVGSHYVQVSNVASGATSLTWDTSFFRQPIGVLPDLLVARAGTLTALSTTGTTAITPNTATLGASNPGGGPAGFLTFSTSPGQTVYVEALGVDPNSNNLLVDAGFAQSSTSLGVFNPNISLFDPTGLIIAQNDDDGVFPVPYTWPNNPAVGIGLGSALLQPITAASAGNMFMLFQENICLVSCTTAKATLVNVVVL